MPLSVRLAPLGDVHWRRYVAGRHDAILSDRPEWLEFVQRLYGQLRPAVLIAEEGDDVRGALPLIEVKHPVFGHFIANAPFYGYGRLPCEDIPTQNALLAAAAGLRAERGARYVVVRLPTSREAPEGWVNDPIYATYILDINGPANELWEKRIGQNARRQTRKAFGHGASVLIGADELQAEAWHVVTHAMRELGSPVHSSKYLPELFNGFPGMVTILLIRDEKGLPAGAAVVLRSGNNTFLLFGNVLERYRDRRYGNLLYWSLIEHLANTGAGMLDMGRSLIGSGNEEFKLHWRPRKVPLAYWYNQAQGEPPPRPNQGNPSFRLVSEAWRWMPVPLTLALGPFLKRGLC